MAGVEPGDEVVTTPLSFIASANCILYEGGTPVFVDVDERTLNLDPAAVEAAITAADEGARRSSTCSATRWTWMSSKRSPSATT